MASILLADNFPLPPAAVTESIFIGGRKGSGKTNTGQLLFEQMHGLGAQCVALDPVGPWYGLRLSASGKRTGLDIRIFGGDHGDIPITPRGGRLLAQMIVERGISCVIDLMAFRPTQRKEFSRDFAQELFELKKRKKSPLHLFVEEARLFAPQQPKASIDVEMCDAFEQIVRLGRNYGLGVSLLDQRPQSVNKEVTSQTEILIVHQITEKLGRKEIEDWVRAKSVNGAEALEQLAELRTGEAFLWSPGLLRKFARIKVHKKATYDASKTPELGEVDVAAPRPLSAKDLQALHESMAEVVKEAEANDPAKLRARIRELEARPVGPAKTVEKVVEKVVEVAIPVVDPTMQKRLADLETTVGTHLRDAVERAMARIAQFSVDLAKYKPNRKTAIVSAPAVRTETRGLLTLPMPRPVGQPARGPKDKSNLGGDAFPHMQADAGDLNKAELRILGAISWLNSIGIAQPNVAAVAFLAGYSPGGHFDNTKGGLRTKGLIEYPSGGHLALTELGREHAPAHDRPMTVKEMHDAVMAKLNTAERRIMTPILEAWPRQIAVEEVAKLSGYNPGGHFDNTKGRLRTIGLIDYPAPGHLRANDFLFPGA